MDIRLTLVENGFVLSDLQTKISFIHTDIEEAISKIKDILHSEIKENEKS